MVLSSSPLASLLFAGSSSVDAGAPGGSGAARPQIVDAKPFPSVPSGGGASGSVSPLAFFFGIFAALAALSVAAQGLSRWIRLTPDLRRPPEFISLLERPG
jgi:hypothetical protein